MSKIIKLRLCGRGQLFPAVLLIGAEENKVNDHAGCPFLNIGGRKPRLQRHI